VDTDDFFVDMVIFIIKSIMRERKKKLIVCNNPNCCKEFLKDESEVKRNKKIGRQNYCSRSCSGHMSYEHLQKYSKENVKYLKPFTNNRRDKFTGLREHYRRIKKRDYEYNITLDDLYEQWETQSGICVYSGVKLTHPNEDGSNINTASLDRIDSNYGYLKGNIQFISIMCNYAKNNSTNEQMIEFLNIIYGFVKDKLKTPPL